MWLLTLSLPASLPGPVRAGFARLLVLMGFCPSQELLPILLPGMGPLAMPLALI